MPGSRGADRDCVVVGLQADAVILWVGLQADAMSRIATEPVGLKPDPQAVVT